MPYNEKYAKIKKALTKPVEAVYNMYIRSKA